MTTDIQMNEPIDLDGTFEMTSISDEERATLIACETRIRDNIDAFKDVVGALRTIRDGRLYRAKFGSFAAYCEQVWGVPYRSVNRHIKALEVEEDIIEQTPEEDRDQLVLPGAESQKREIAKAPPEERAEVWAETQERTGLEQPPARELKETVDAKVSASSSAPDPVVLGMAKELEQIKGGRMQDHMDEARVLRRRGVTVDDAYPVDGDSYSTPDKIINRVRETFEGGVIDLDPATHSKAQELIQAVDHFTIDDDGLKQEWYGRVWLNPPYSSVGPWIDKLYDDVMHDRVSEAMVIVNIDVGRQWWAKLVDMSRAHATPFERVQFWHPDQRATIGNNRHSQAVFYIGTEAGMHRFAHAFEYDWDVCVPYKRMQDIERRRNAIRSIITSLIDPTVNRSEDLDCETWANILGELSRGHSLNAGIHKHASERDPEVMTMWREAFFGVGELAWEGKIPGILRRDHQDLVARVLGEAGR